MTAGTYAVELGSKVVTFEVGASAGTSFESDPIELDVSDIIGNGTITVSKL